MPIEGIKLSISSAELKKICEQRVEYHHARAKKAQERVEKLTPALKEIRENIEEEDEEFAGMAAAQMKYAASNSNRGGFDEQDALGHFQAAFKHHNDRATVFRFMAEHVIPNETYVLTESDLQKLEVIKPARW